MKPVANDFSLRCACPATEHRAESAHMKQVWALVMAMTTALTGMTQQQTGTVLYERTIQMQIRLPGTDGQAANTIPKSKTDTYELQFANNQSVWQQAAPDNTAEDAFPDEGGMRMSVNISGSDDIIYHNFETGKMVAKRELLDKTFIIDDSITQKKWKITGETKNILGHACLKAQTTLTRKMKRSFMKDGEMGAANVTDTLPVTAWITNEIAVPAGPAEYQGQLPGLILEMEIGDGKEIYKATKITGTAKTELIRPPAGKKTYTKAAFEKESEKLLDNFRKSNPRRRGFRVGG